MSKKLDLTKSVYELTEEYPELIDILNELGFTEITKPAMRASVGRMMTIPKGAKTKNISMMKVVPTLMKNGFELVGKMPNIKFGGKGKSSNTDENEAAEDNSTTEKIKGYLKRLGEGEDLESVRADFVENFAQVDASEIMKAEQQLMAEGTPLEEVQRLCDVHSALFHGKTREEQIANAEKAVEESLKKQREEKSKGMPEAFTSKHELAKKLRETEGHPLQTFSRENMKIGAFIKVMQAETDVEVLAEDLKELRQISVHYAKKGDILYPLLKVRYEISGPSDVMWTVDDEIRDELAALDKEKNHDDKWKSRLDAVLIRADEMVYKEENILFPICAVNFTKEEWYLNYEDAKDYKIIFDVEGVWDEAENFIAKRNASRNAALNNGEIVMPGGHMTVEQLTAVLNTLPVEISFIDDNNINRFFNEGPKVFKRPQLAIDREVFSCHPPKIEPMVRMILDDFREGKRDEVPVWMEKEGKPFLVKYMAVRDKAGKYLGTMEVVQDMQFAKEHFE